MHGLLQLAIYASAFTALGGCASLCDNEIAQVTLSPSGELTAVVFNRNCGATTGFNTQVSVLPSAELPTNDPGNLLILDGQVPLQIFWASDSQLSVVGLGASHVFKQEAQTSGVTVSYSR
jgi:hypothetical protein